MHRISSVLAFVGMLKEEISFFPSLADRSLSWSELCRIIREDNQIARILSYLVKTNIFCKSSAPSDSITGNARRSRWDAYALKSFPELDKPDLKRWKL